MKRYRIIFEAPAVADLQASYDWGCRYWGVEQANKWVRELRQTCLHQLATLPERHPIAPENGEFSETVRQMIIGRYRVLYTIRSRRVHILHIRGAYFDENFQKP